jgi:tRNA A-37 threonylcarbamoyl transferase component Bud32
MAADLERDLLTGILAIRMKFVDPDTLRSILGDWLLQRDKSLTSVLFDRQTLTDDRLAELEALVRVQQERDSIEANTSPLRATATDPTDFDTPSPAVWPTTIESDQPPATWPTTIDRDPPISSDTQSDTPPSDPAPPGPGPDGTWADVEGDAPESGRGQLDRSGRRFRILRRHAEGGLGVVYVAHDAELNREVALKEIRGSYADDSKTRNRFLREAEVTGRLEHPGIVPVYGLGRDATGRPFYAMRLIRGESLELAIHRFHRDDSWKATGQRILALQKLLRHFLDVCNTIEYAHSRGVLHRDIKPSNIMIGPYGETLVVDWGLAKPLSPSDPDQLAANDLWPRSTAGGGSETLPGAVVGTPAFISPDQVAGRPDAQTPKSDVYCLGATQRQ